MFTVTCLCGFCAWSLFCYTVFNALSSFEIISLRKRAGCFSIFSLCCYVAVSFLCLFVTVPWLGLACMIVEALSCTHFYSRVILLSVKLVAIFTKIHKSSSHACADPESIVRGDITLIFRGARLQRLPKDQKRAIIGLPAKHHEMAFRWRADNGSPLNANFAAFLF